jgi:hypothetical protein
MNKLAILVIAIVALAGCGRETGEIESKAPQAQPEAKVLTVAWHKILDEDGSVCDLSVDTEAVVKQACDELRRVLAPDGVDVVVKTLSPAKEDGADCLCNRVLIQGRYVDEWLGAEVTKASCSGCPNQAGCTEGTAPTVTCAGKTHMTYRGKTYEIIPSNFIVMAGMIAAADLTGEKISYEACPGVDVCQGECICGRCEAGCVAEAAQAAAATDKAACPYAARCTGNACTASGD